MTHNNAMNRSRENLPVTISADWHSPIISATIYLRVARRGSIIADVIWLKEHLLIAIFNRSLAAHFPSVGFSLRGGSVCDV